MPDFNGPDPWVPSAPWGAELPEYATTTAFSGAGGLTSTSQPAVVGAVASSGAGTLASTRQVGAVTAVGTGGSGALTLTGSQTVNPSYSTAVLVDSPFLYWRLGESSGTTVTDASGNGHHGTYLGSPTLGVTGLVPNDSNKAVTFDDVDDAATVSLDGVARSPFSIELIFKSSTHPSTSKFLVQRRISSTWSHWSIYIDSDGYLYASIRRGGMFFGDVSGGGYDLCDGIAHHVVLTYDNRNIRLYVDGILRGSVDLNGPIVEDPDAVYDILSVGRSDGGGLVATYDEVSYYTTVLPPTKVAAHAAGAQGQQIPGTPMFASTGSLATTGVAAVVQISTLSSAPTNLVASNAGYGSAFLQWTPGGSFDFQNGMPPGITHHTTGPATIVNDTDPITGTTKALQPADLDDSTTAWSEFPLDVETAGPLTFRYHVESENNWDYGRIYVDGTEILALSGPAGGWSSVTSPSLTAGTHTIRLEFTKDGSQSVGFDNIHLGRITGAAPTGYEYRVDGGTPVSLGSNATSATVSGLSEGSHNFEVRAISGSETSTWSNLSTALVTSGALNVNVSAALSGGGSLSAVGAVVVAVLSPAETTITVPSGEFDDPQAADSANFDIYPQSGYRYFTFDIMSDELLSEIPLSDVTFSVKLGAVGELTATLPIGQLDYDIDAYGATMPMRTALYVLRDNKAVWGGIIWARDYNANSRTLQLSCATWESYLFRRHMWHTYQTRDDVDQFEIVRQMLYKMRHDFEFDYTPYDYVIPQPQASTVDIFVDQGQGAGRTQNVMTFDRNEMKSFGDVLTEYANNLNGFEWYFRIDFNERALRFRRRLMLLRTPPALLPKGSDDPPADEEHRPGIDTYLFEYPGNIASISVSEDGDNACTRQFVVGGNPAGGSTKSIGSWNNAEYLAAGYPLIESIEASKHHTVTNPTTLINLATVYGRDSAPPMRNWNIVVNGSMDPIVGSYRVGHWCRLVVNDPFLKRSLEASSDFDPLGGVVKRIVGYSVAVPNSAQTSEMVTLELEDDPTVTFDLTEAQEEGSVLEERGPFYYGTYMPDATSAGVVNPGALTNYNAANTNTVTIPAGRVIEDKIIHGDVFVSSGAAGPVILRRCRLVGGDVVPGTIRGVVNVDAAPGKVALKMYDCDISPKTQTRRRDGIVGRGFEAYRVLIDDVVQGIVMDPGDKTNTDMAVRVKGCWVRRLLRVDNRNARCLSYKGGRNVEVTGNRFSGSAHLNLDNPGDFTGSTTDYIVAQEYADEVLYLDDVSGVAGSGPTVFFKMNFIGGGTVQTRIRASIGSVNYSSNKHFWDVAKNVAAGYPGTWISIESRATNLIVDDPNIWRDGPYATQPPAAGTPLTEPQAMGILYEGA